MKRRSEIREESHCWRLPSGNIATCREDGVVQIGNEEVTRTDIILLAEHLKTCSVIPGRATTKKGAR